MDTRFPEVSNNNLAPFPAGFASVQATLDYKTALAQSQKQDRYYSSGNSSLQDHSIRRHEIVFALSANQKGRRPESVNNMPLVISSYNGLPGVPCANESFETIADELGAAADTYIQDLVTSHMQILGVAFADFEFKSNKSNLEQGFAVQIAGVAHVQVSEYMPVGALAVVQAPRKEDWLNGYSGAKRSYNESKIVPIVTAGHPDDPCNFAMRVVHRYIYNMIPRKLDPMLNSKVDKRVLAEGQFASAMAQNALLNGVLFVNMLMKYDIVSPSPIFEGTFNNGEMEPRFDLERYKNFISSERVMRSRKQDTRRMHLERKGLGHTLWLVPGNNDRDMATYPVPDRTPTEDINQNTPLLPEEASTIIAKGVGLFGPNNRDLTSTRRMATDNIRPTRGEWMANVLQQHPEMEEERKMYEQMTHEFLKQVFVSQHKNKIDSSNRHLEFGYLDYEEPNASRHIGRIQRASRMITPIDKKSYAGILCSKQVNSLYNLTNGLYNVFNVFRGRIIGRVLKAGKPGGYADVQLQKTV